MTVKELITELRKCKPDNNILLLFGCTGGKPDAINDIVVRPDNDWITSEITIHEGECVILTHDINLPK